MKDLVIEGKADLEGTVAISGFKHSLAPILAACAFVDGQSTIRNVPDIEDSAVLCEIFSLLGAQIQRTGDSLTIDTQNLAWRAISDPLMARVHSSIYMIPCLLGRLGEVDLGPSGGCPLGDQDQPSRRPVHHILNVLEQFGARFNTSEDRIRGRCSGFRCAHIDIRNYWTDKKVIAGPLASGATKTALLASTIAKGTSIIDSPYRKAEVEEMLAFFQSAGVAVEDRGSRLIIEGRPTLRSGNHALIPDLIEVVTFIACGLYLQRPIRLQIVADKRVRLGLAAELEVLESMGADLEWEEGVITVPQTGILKGVDIEVTPQSIYSDSHPLLALVLLSADRPSRIVEKVWPQRFHYARELVKMGAQLHVKNGVLDITPQRPFRSGVQVHGGDLRSAAVLLLAALGIEGSTTLRGAEHIDRGYEDFVGKLEKLGARITSF
jgi:UDP-N-acetylglucosamine 1-carboxyvinyltransferase